MAELPRRPKRPWTAQWEGRASPRIIIENTPFAPPKATRVEWPCTVARCYASSLRQLTRGEGHLRLVEPRWWNTNGPRLESQQQAGSRGDSNRPTPIEPQTRLPHTQLRSVKDKQVGENSRESIANEEDWLLFRTAGTIEEIICVRYARSNPSTEPFTTMRRLDDGEAHHEASQPQSFRQSWPHLGFRAGDGSVDRSLPVFSFLPKRRSFSPAWSEALGQINRKHTSVSQYITISKR
jgi:hypothetical protein